MISSQNQLFSGGGGTYSRLLSAALALACLFASTAAPAADYYNCASGALAADSYQPWVKIYTTFEGIDNSSISGVGSSTGWATAKGGARSAAGITAANSTYHIYTDFACRSQTANGATEVSYTTPATSSVVVEEGITWLIMGKQGTGVLTLNNARLSAGSTLHYYNNGNNGTGTLAGSIAMEESSSLLLSGRRYPESTWGEEYIHRAMILASTVTGRGAIVFFRFDNGSGYPYGTVAHKITGDIGGFTGDLCVFDYTDHKNLSLELVNANSIPGDPPAGETAYVVVTNGATLKIDHNWVSPKNRVWDFGGGAFRPTIEVAAGKTVEIRGEVRGSAGFVKTGAGTLVLSGASSSLSGECDVLSGKVVLKGAAAGLRARFPKQMFPQTGKGELVIPAGYTLLDSVSLKGGAADSYIDTGYTPQDAAFGFLLDYRVDREIVTGYTTTRLAGSDARGGTGSWVWSGFMIGISVPTDTGSTETGGEFTFGVGGFLPSAGGGGQVGNERMRMSLRNGVARLSRGWSRDFGAASPAFYGSVYLGNIHTVTVNDRAAPVTIYRFEVYAGDTLIHDFVPVTRASDGAVGLYDARGDKGFRPAADAQYITAGPVYAGDDWLEVISGFMVIVK